MKIYEQIYVSNNIGKKRETILKKVIQKKIQFHIYLIVLSETTGEQLELFNVDLALQSFFANENAKVIGLAKGYDEALELVEEITKDVLEQTGSVKFKEYFSDKGFYEIIES